MREFLLGWLIVTAPLSWGQHYAGVVGLHQTTANTPVDGASVKGLLNVELGLVMAFDVLPRLRLKTGSLYKERHVDLRTTAESMSYDFAYIDVPANAQWNFSDAFGVYAGLVFGINVNDKVKVPVGQPSIDPSAKAIISLVNAGVDVSLSNGFGFDFYYERGLGHYAHNMRDFSTFGGRLNYWF